jgi:hypothetical protein
VVLPPSTQFKNRRLFILCQPLIEPVERRPAIPAKFPRGGSNGETPLIASGRLAAPFL